MSGRVASAATQSMYLQGTHAGDLLSTSLRFAKEDGLKAPTVRDPRRTSLRGCWCQTLLLCPFLQSIADLLLIFRTEAIIKTNMMANTVVHEHGQDPSYWMPDATDGNSSDMSSSNGDSPLLHLVQSYDWSGVLARVSSHPSEARLVSPVDNQRTPLHLACEHDAPAVVIQSLLKAYPEASTLIGTSRMTPLHVACSSSHASAHVIRVLLELGLPKQCSMTDLDGDTPLHAACRCGAPTDVLDVLLKSNPSVVNMRDREGLTPIHRLWVRYFVILGRDAIDGIRGPADLTGQLGEAWSKTELLLRYAYAVSYSPSWQQQQSGTPLIATRILHAASAVDCPRAVVRIASVLYPQQLDEKDEEGRTPLALAAQAPVYRIRDLSNDNDLLEDMVNGYDDSFYDEDATRDIMAEDDDRASELDQQQQMQQASVIEILLQSCQEYGKLSAHIPDKLGQQPLHVALLSGKTWFENGVKQLLEAHQDSLCVAHGPSGLYPFMLAAVAASEDGKAKRGNHGCATSSHRDEDVTTTIYELLRHSPSVLTERMKK